MFDTSRGTAELSVDFDSGRKDLVVHTYQMCVLMLFNEHETISWKQMKATTGIDPDDLERHVLALAHPKVKILLKKPNRKELTDTDKFQLNKGYKNQRVRITIGVLKRKNKSMIKLKKCLNIYWNLAKIVSKQLLYVS